MWRIVALKNRNDDVQAFLRTGRTVPGGCYRSGHETDGARGIAVEQWLETRYHHAP